MMTFISTVYAQEASSPQKAPPGGLFGSFVPLILIGVIFYFLVFRPQQKQQKEKKMIIAALKRGDEVVTNGGIYGKVVELKDTVIMLQIANSVTIKLDRSQVSTVIAASESK